MEKLISDLCQLVGIDIEDLFSPSRKDKLVKLRRHIYWILNKRGYSPSQIGRLLNRDHSTIFIALQKVEKDSTEAERLNAECEQFFLEFFKENPEEIVNFKKQTLHVKGRYDHINYEPINQGFMYEEYIKKEKQKAAGKIREQRFCRQSVSEL